MTCGGTKTDIPPHSLDKNKRQLEQILHRIAISDVVQDNPRLLHRVCAHLFEHLGINSAILFELLIKASSLARDQGRTDLGYIITDLVKLLDLMILSGDISRSYLSMEPNKDRDMSLYYDPNTNFGTRGDSVLSYNRVHDELEVLEQLEDPFINHLGAIVRLRIGEGLSLDQLVSSAKEIEKVNIDSSPIEQRLFMASPIRVLQGCLALARQVCNLNNNGQSQEAEFVNNNLLSNLEDYSRFFNIESRKSASRPGYRSLQVLIAEVQDILEIIRWKFSINCGTCSETYVIDDLSRKLQDLLILANNQ